MKNFFESVIIKASNSVSTVWPWFGRKANKIATNRIINRCRHRPHPWSMIHDYVSWSSLTEKLWSARHLPAKELNSPKRKDLENLFKRTKQRLSPKSTCLFPAFAQYLTDGFIRTRMPDKDEDPDPKRKQNTSTHQLDLSSLYGRTPEQTKALRLLSENNGQKGKLKSQMINNEEYPPFLYDGQEIKLEFKILDEPLMSDTLKGRPEIRSKIFAVGGDRANANPQVAMMNTLFLREHNRLAGVIERANTEWDDERVFQVSRNITIVLFLKIVIEEYINHISPSFKFLADPTIAWNAPWNKPNWLTTEFSLLYRWHQLIPDDNWWGGKKYSVRETIMNNNLLLNVGLKQGFLDMSDQYAGEISPFNTAPDLLHLEKMAIEQGRLCKLASYSDYRNYVNLKRPGKFSDVSSNDEVVNFLQSAYESVDDIEFYVGLFAEDLERNSPLSPLLLRMVAVDAFSQALTNPLLSEHVWKEETFTKAGWELIGETKNLRDILHRNVKGGLDDNDFIGITHHDWKPN